MEITKIYCSDCGEDITAQSDPQDKEPRQPCPECGGTGRTHKRRIDANATGTPAIAGSMKSAKKVDSGKRKRRERRIKFGASYFHDRQKNVDRLLDVDRVEGTIEEKIIDPDTGETIRHTKGRLPDHKGHGSDKKSKN